MAKKDKATKKKSVNPGFEEKQVKRQVSLIEEIEETCVEEIQEKEDVCVDAIKEDCVDAIKEDCVEEIQKKEKTSLITNFKQFIEIAREIDNTSLNILMLDEPTSSLNIEETKILLSHLKDLAESGISIIFISHRLEEVVEICHRVTVLRDGEIIKEYRKEDYDINKLALDMIGKEVVQTLRHRKKIAGSPIISFKNIEVSYGNNKHTNISLDINEGEVLGITGLAGHGQEVFGYGLMGEIALEY